VMDPSYVLLYAASRNRFVLILNNPLITDCQRLQSIMEMLMAVMAYQWVLFIKRSCCALSSDRLCFGRIVDLSILGFVSVAKFICWRNL